MFTIAKKFLSQKKIPKKKFFENEAWKFMWQDTMKLHGAMPRVSLCVASLVLLGVPAVSALHASHSQMRAAHAHALLRGGAGFAKPANKLPQLMLRGGASPEEETVRGVLAIVAVIFAEVELFGQLSKRRVLPSVVTRKLTHVFAGSSMLTLFYLFPVGHSRAGRLAVALFLCSFVAVFSLAAHIPEEELEALPSFLRTRIRNLAAMACRTVRKSVP